MIPVWPDCVLHYEDPVSWPLTFGCTWGNETILDEAHGGRFRGHFAEKRVYTQLRWDYWWNGMQGDIWRHCKVYLVLPIKATIVLVELLQSIPVSGPFHTIGVDVLQLWWEYVVVFMDYLTKWCESFAVADQTAETVAKLLVEEVICRHGVPERLPSDWDFLSGLIWEGLPFHWNKEINTSGYFPQTDGLVEKFKSTLLNMLSKVVPKPARDLDT